MLFGSRIELCQVSTKSRVIRTFRKIGTPLFILSGISVAEPSPAACAKKIKKKCRSKNYYALRVVLSYCPYLCSCPLLSLPHTCFLPCHPYHTWFRTRVDQQLGQAFWTFIQHYYLFLNCVPLTYSAFQAPHTTF